jgi:hypothetical protein
MSVRALAVLFAVLPFPDVLVSIGPYHGALALPLAVFEFPDVLGSIGVCVRTETSMKNSRGRGTGR